MHGIQQNVSSQCMGLNLNIVPSEKLMSRPQNEIFLTIFSKNLVKFQVYLYMYPYIFFPSLFSGYNPNSKTIFCILYAVTYPTLYI
jgi:hypothetical protein